MSEMVERVARALCEAIGFPPDAQALEAGRVQTGWEMQLPKARAAIAAMREPTEAMTRAGNCKAVRNIGTAGELRLGPSAISDGWRAMIDTVLAEDDNA